MATRYYDRIDGQRVVRGAIHNINGRRVRFHAIRKFDRLYWTANAGTSFHKDKATAVLEGGNLDILPARTAPAAEAR